MPLATRPTVLFLGCCCGTEFKLPLGWTVLQNTFESLLAVFVENYNNCSFGWASKNSQAEIHSKYPVTQCKFPDSNSALVRPVQMCACSHPGVDSR